MDKKLKSVDAPQLSEGYNKIMRWFFDFSTSEFSLNDLCSGLNISKTSANTLVERLIKEGFLNRKILGKLWSISCNQKHSYNITRKIPYHLNMIYESDILEKIHSLLPGARSIILFGSYRKGDDIETSDIDIAIEIIGDDASKIIEFGKISRFGYRHNVPVSLHVFSRNHVSSNMFANIANGIILEGFLEVKP